MNNSAESYFGYESTFVSGKGGRFPRHFNNIDSVNEPIIGEQFKPEPAYYETNRENNFIEVDDEGNYTVKNSSVVDIKEIFPLSPLLVLEKTWHYLFFVILTLTIYVGRNGWEELFYPHHWTEALELLLIRVKLFMWTVAGLYWEWIRRGTEIYLYGLRLEIAQGIFFKKRASVHLLPHTTVYVLRHGWFDHIFNTATLKVCPVNMPDEDLVTITCLPIDRAHRLRRYLTQQIDKQLNVDKDHPVFVESKKVV
jgi:hypothetical protein